MSESNEKEFVKGELFVILIYVSDTLMVEWHAVVFLLHDCELLMATLQRDRELLLALSLPPFECVVICDHAGFSMC